MGQCDATFYIQLSDSSWFYDCDFHSQCLTMDQFSSSNSNFTCPNVKQSSLFIVYTVFLIIFSFASTIFTIVLMKLIPNHSLFHANVRLTLQNFCITNLLTSIMLCFRGIKNLGVITFGYEVVEFSPLFCLAVNEFRNTINSVAMVSMSVIGFERLIATLRKKYVDPDHPSRTMKIIITLIWFGALVNGMYSWYAHSSDSTLKVCYCYMASNTNTNFIISSFIPYFIIEAATITCFLLVLYFNNRLSESIMNVSKHSLQARYIIWSNIATTRSLLPTVIVNSLLYLVIIITQFVMKVTSSNNAMLTSIISWSVTFILVTFGSFIEPILLIKFNRKLEMAIKNDLKRYLQSCSFCSKLNNQVEPIDLKVVSYKVHPDQSQIILEEIWTKKSMYKRVKK